MQHHSAFAHRSRLRLRMGSIASLATLGAVLAISLGVGTPVASGGWAVGSLDALPDARAGQIEQVGFTILQHGITPAHFADEGEGAGDVGIEIVRSDGEVEFFAALPEATVGHYVADVTFPVAGDHSWSIRMGWFPPQDLDALTVTADAGSSFGAGDAWSAARWGLLGAVALLTAIAVADLLVGRRRTAAAPS